MITLFVIGFWLVVWEITSHVINNHILLVGPIATLTQLFYLAGTSLFWASISTSLVRVLTGFFLALGLGVGLAVLSYRYGWVYRLLLPLFHVMKAIPVASFVIIAIFWVGASHLSVFISFVTVIPIIYFNTHKGLLETDKGLLEMAKVLKVSPYKKLKFIYTPAVIPYVTSGITTGFGFAWKSGIAAELIGTSRDTIGFNLHMARVFLQTADLFAWTFTIVFLCFLIEQLFFMLFRRVHDSIS